MKKEKRYLVPGDYMADPAVHVFNDRLSSTLPTIGKVVFPKMIMATISI